MLRIQYRPLSLVVLANRLCGFLIEGQLLAWKASLQRVKPRLDIGSMLLAVPEEGAVGDGGTEKE